MQPSRRLFLALAAGVAVATVYVAQPLVVTMGTELGIPPSRVGLFVTITQLGYGLGLFFLVPLGDLVDRRRLIRLQFLLLATALLVVATAPGAAVLLLGLAAIGLLAVVTQSLVAFAASLSRPAEVGRVVGAVTSGIVIGILLARTVSGMLADLAGWRSVYLAAGILSLLIALILFRTTPQNKANLSYYELLRSTMTLWTDEPLFRTRAVLALLVFAAFSTLWSSIALPLSAPPYELSHTAIGAFGLVGAAGALAAGPAGRLNDRGRGSTTTWVALVLLTASWLPLAFTSDFLWALAIGAILLDLAVQAVHVSSQSMIYGLRPDAGSRLIGGYMVFYSIGSGLGAISSTALYAAGGWTAVCLLGATFSLSALAVAVRAGRSTSRASRPCGSCR
ncbi:putative MFS family arabinose efflux permease [Kribbella voronezhensis]|uniref:Putative MFS family arabinose efflux permease n=1 Tax=Kribbella voronezhensis TaxID=2512212 RepID=A0A4R7TFU9_9ACTN|nr:MFS transporter [Kribbella voronezhensis]TDU91085.1 putative MFS family arabinose efflux permease [Kribbella voronezhensis]